MRRLFAILACALTFSTHAQVLSTIPAIIMPNPLGIVLTVGQWLLKDGKPAIYYIEVAGDGATPDEARTNGFRLAVESAIGSIIASETEVQNGRIKRDEIISYAAGYIDKFEIIATEPGPQGSRVRMRVWVGRSALANRLLARSQTLGEVQGDQAAVTIGSLQQERSTGDRLLATVLNDFPKRSFSIITQPSSIEFTSNRQGNIQIPFELRWDSRYLSSLWEALNRTSQGRGIATVTVLYKPEGNWLRYEGGNAEFSDNVKPTMIWDKFARSEPRLQVSILDSADRTLRKACYLIPELDQYYQYNQPTAYMIQATNRGIRIDGGVVHKGLVKMPMGPELAQAQKVKLEVVLNQDCSKN